MDDNDKPVKGPQVVCSALIEKDGRFLIFLCPRFKVWRVPGGRAEFNETLEETLAREMMEEVGIGVSDPKLLGYGQDHQYHVRDHRETSRLLMFFHVKADGELKIDPDEADQSKWVTLDELKHLENKEGGLTDFFDRNPGIEF